MTEPLESAVDTVINSDFVERITMSFSLFAVVAEHPERNKTRPSKLDRGMLYRQSTDGLGARVALLQSPIPPIVPTSLLNPCDYTKPKRRSPLTPSCNTTTKREVSFYP